MTEQELRQLALDISDGKVFGSWMLENLNLLSVVFLPLALGGQSHLSEDTACLYEYFDQAGSRSINGYPCFMSMRILSRDDLAKLQPMLTEIQSFKQKFMGEPDNATITRGQDEAV